MKTLSSSQFLVRFGLTLAAAIIACLQPVRAGEPANKMPMMEGKMMERCEKMKEQKQTMMGEMKAQDVALATAVVKMNAATGEEKSAQLAAIVTSLVEQRTAMRVGMAKMQDQMMSHMMDHMQNGKESMMSCPMMSDADDKSSDAHKEHHE